MTTEAKHKSCPFCGQEDDGINLECIVHPLGYKMKAIQCHPCGMIGPIAYDSERATWKAWDERKVKDGE